MDNENVEASGAPWPNRLEPVDGVVPGDQVSQDPTLFDDLEDDEEATA